MSHEDFDIASLAAYLHLTPQQVERLANRGKVPGRKVAGQWRFSTAEIHHWMEERIGLLDDEELAQVEDALDRAAVGSAERPINLAQLLPPDRIAVPLIARTRGSVIRALVDLSVQSGVLWDPDRMADAVRRREEMQSTAMDNGVALLHPRRPIPDAMAEGFLTLGISPQGIPFGGSHVLTDIFFLIGSVDDQSHLRTLARISRLISDQDLLNSLRHAADATSAYETIIAKEQDLG